ncbi:MAG TPA: mechanosensitive ion channel family protein [Terriglobales bacterium]|nr:mechanosensitive ion channel family protein [Terriglobales bacterium]
MKKFALLTVVLALSTLGLVAQSVTNLLGGTQPHAAATTQTDPLGRNTPSGTVVGFLQSEQNGNDKAAADYLQMSASRRQSQGADVAQKLKLLMDRAFVGRLSRISTSPEGDPTNGIDTQTVGTFSVGDTEVPVVLVRVTDPAAGKIWLFSADTLSKVPDLYDNIEAYQVETKLPNGLVRNVFLGMPLWQWLALIAAIPVAAAIGWAIVLFLAIPRRFYLKYRNRPNLHSYSQVSKPLLVFFGAIAHRIIASYLGLPLLPRFYYYRTIGALVSIGFFWFLARVSTITMQRLRRHAISVGRTGTGTLMLLGERMLVALIFILAALAILAILGFNLTTLLAGLGIGGIAIAFAAQKTLENLFGGISVLADEVIRVGDTCKFGDRVGTVEDISLRSTRIRTAERTELSIPNGALATMNVENLSRRDKILFNPSLGVRAETSPDQLRYLLAELRRLLYEHPKVESSSARVRLASCDPSGYGLEVFSYVLTRDFAEFTAIREDLLLRVIEIVTQSGTGLAFPSQTLYLGRDPGLDRDKTAAAEHAVQQWRDQHELPFPDFTPEQKASFRGSITYPPPGSSLPEKPLGGT